MITTGDVDMVIAIPVALLDTRLIGVSGTTLPGALLIEAAADIETGLYHLDILLIEAAADIETGLYHLDILLIEAAADTETGPCHLGIHRMEAPEEVTGPATGPGQGQNLPPHIDCRLIPYLSRRLRSLNSGDAKIRIVAKFGLEVLLVYLIFNEVHQSS
eukprot:c12792_g1_i1 orf=86-565(+)